MELKAQNLIVYCSKKQKIMLIKCIVYITVRMHKNRQDKDRA